MENIISTVQNSAMYLNLIYKTYILDMHKFFQCFYNTLTFYRLFFDRIFQLIDSLNSCLTSETSEMDTHWKFFDKQTKGNQNILYSILLLL